ncbi:hypothetical protein [Gluconacetobacter tumulisoli]|uniref:Uncharacterized protein n=1 Tax=Gluconacetobacter tumulisoli TaxID=1286189 RepID=A0A7W4K4A8_9PROT|nr:hypothetical protein [Gluconacetobacter tumulisoli]MBB2200113.1 hypothetical protein [Gluconacetobacter tumulisoli]
MFGKRLAGHPTGHRLSDNTRQTIGGVVIVLLMLVAIAASIMLSPMIPLGH